MRTFRTLCVAAVGSLAAGVASAQTDSFHQMQIEQIVGGLGGDSSKHAIQLRMRGPHENLVTQGRLVAYDAAGANPVLLTDFPTNVPVPGTGGRILIVSTGFPSPVTPDFTMTNPIPPGYLLAGKVTFEDDIGGILWSVAFGGANYTGTNLGLFTNDPDGNFGPAFPGPLPLLDNRALQFQGTATATSTTNAADYLLTTGPATLFNNAGASGVLGPTCYPDCNKDGATTVADFGCFQTKFVLQDGGADCSGDGSLTVADFGCFQTKFVLGCLP